MVELETINLLVQIVGVSATAIAAVIGVRSYIVSNKRAEDAKKKEQETQELALKTQQQNLETRQAQLLIGIYQALVSPEMMEANLKLQDIEMENVHDWNKLCKNKEKYKAWTLWSAYYQGIGVLVKEKLIDVSLPAQLWGGNVLWFYERYDSMMKDCREKLNWPGWGLETEFLYNSILEYGKSHPETGLWSSGRKFTPKTA